MDLVGLAGAAAAPFLALRMRDGGGLPCSASYLELPLSVLRVLELVEGLEI